MVAVIDSITWTVLVPMLLAVPDPAKREYWIARMYCFESYNVRDAPLPHSAPRAAACCVVLPAARHPC